ncbi:Ig-like domain-containing protein [Paenibacillus mucilaginosus]|uniref:Ig-like domain-containing protein n=1 Tax=Paenibacillus mucilaginosus TaxID=61624 RepID=UPI001EE67227|nr:Ig-like domain-containing protein [Paenibacillus mucilaginosus]
MASCFSKAARRFTLLTVLILGLQLPLSANAKSSIDVRITSPQNEQKVGGQLKVEASISSEYELKEAKASVGGIEAPLFQSCSGCSTWTGTLNTSSLTQGPHSVIVNATDVKKKTGTASAPFVHDEVPPVVP